MPLCCVWWACSSGFTKSALSVEPLLLNEVLIMLRFSFTSLSLSPFLCFFYFCMCHAARGKSLQPDCEMMSQIHKTLTGSFQILFIIYHPYFIFLWEDLYGCVQAYTCWCTLCCVCCCGCAHICQFTAWSCMIHILGDYKRSGSCLSSLTSFPHIWPGTKVKEAEQFCSPIKAFTLFFSITLAPSDYGFWFFCSVGITPNPILFNVGVLIVCSEIVEMHHSWKIGF